MGDENVSVVITRPEKPNSYEFGKAGSRFKLYFATPEDLRAQMDSLKALGYDLGEAI